MKPYIPVLTAYLLGGIPFGLLISKMAGIVDIRKIGSGNIGATNVWRAAGFKTAIWVYVADIGKAVLAVMIAKWFIGQNYITGIDPDIYLVICAVVCILGSIFPIYLKFKGGKGVNTTLGSISTLLPFETLIAAGVFFITVWLSKYVSLSSILATLTLLIVLLIESLALGQDIAVIYIALAGAIFIMILLTHRKNIIRISKGTENKISRSQLKEETAHD